MGAKTKFALDSSLYWGGPDPSIEKNFHHCVRSLPVRMTDMTKLILEAVVSGTWGLGLQHKPRNSKEKNCKTKKWKKFKDF